MLCVQVRRVPVVMASMLCRRLHTPWMVIPVVVDLAEDALGAQDQDADCDCEGNPESGSSEAVGKRVVWRYFNIILEVSLS